ncbi:MAG: NAD(P)/FAD-dependent oxidoreductase [Methanobrevibacter sp.]|nr:NAD(P)/FAD-dependent oxidoreductase [Methanobrevibacter sp.]
MSLDSEVVIIGSGPVGSTIAYYLSQRNLDVTLVDKKNQIGYPLQCAGILSKHIFDYNELPDNLILNTVKGAFLHTQNHILKVEKQENVAYIIDRIAYDEHLFKRAIENGVKFINEKAIDYDVENGIAYLSHGTQINSKVIIGCEGYNSGLSQKMGNTQSNFNASQMLVEISDENIQSFRDSTASIDEYVDTYLTNDILPGFLWVIPLGNNQFRVGLFSNHTHKQQNDMLNDFLNQNFEYEIIEKYKGFIPIFNEKNLLVKGHAVLIGDAAGQVKPTSGGGLLIGFDACEMASRHVANAVENDDISLLRDYQKEFHKKYHKEFSYQFKVQRTLGLLSDEDLDYFFMKLRQNDCERIISEYGDMDRQSTLVKEFIKRGLIFKIMPTFLFKKIINIFGFR